MPERASKSPDAEHAVGRAASRGADVSLIDGEAVLKALTARVTTGELTLTGTTYTVT